MTALGVGLRKGNSGVDFPLYSFPTFRNLQCVCRVDTKSLKFEIKIKMSGKPSLYSRLSAQTSGNSGLQATCLSEEPQFPHLSSGGNNSIYFTMGN